MLHFKSENATLEKSKAQYDYECKIRTLSENCGYCSQSSISKAPIDSYRMVDKTTLLEGAKRAHDLNIGTYCIVASGRGPSNRDVDQVVGAVKEIKETYGLKVCACLGLLKPEQAERLKEAGVDRYNHNINTSKSNHSNITTSHTYDDRVNTVETAKNPECPHARASLSG